MNPSKLVVTALLLALFSALGAGISVYSHFRNAAALEGGELRTPNAVSLDPAKVDLTKALDSDDLNGRVFQNLDDSGRVRVVRTLGNPEPLPIHAGRQIHPGEQHVALVGASVKTKLRGGEQYFDYAGQDYPVVGQLGMHKQGLLEQDVLLADAELFTTRESVVVDVQGGVGALKGIPSGSTEALSGSTDQRTNIDYVSPILITCGWSLTFLGAISSGVLIGGYIRPSAVMQYRLGLRRTQVLSRSMVRLIAAAAATFVVVCSVTLMSSGGQQAIPTTLGAAALPLLVALAVTGVSIVGSLWGRER